MTKPTKTSSSRRTVEPLIPKALSSILGRKPVLWYESEEDYDHFCASCIAEFDPKDCYEFLLVKDFVDAIWQVESLKRLKLRAIHEALPIVVGKELASAYIDAKLDPERKQVDEAEALLVWLAAGMIMGDEQITAEFNTVLSKLGVSQASLHLATHRMIRDDLALFDAEIDVLERQRNKALKLLEDRRASLAAQGRSLLARRDAQDVIVDIQGKGGHKAA